MIFSLDISRKSTTLFVLPSVESCIMWGKFLLLSLRYRIYIGFDASVEQELGMPPEMCVFAHVKTFLERELADR
jgi:hypothetical protein